MDVIIIEDETLAGRRLHDLIKKYDPLTRVLAKIDSVKSSVKWFKENAHPDLVFMDIQLADGLCFEIFEEVTPNAPVIFTTAFDEYAIRAFKVNSIDYLLKPIDFDELSFAIDKYHKLTNTTDAQIPVVSREVSETVIRLLKNEYKERFAVKIGEHIRAFTAQDICCFYSFEKTTYALLNNKRAYIVDYSIEQLENILNPKHFFRVNRKFIVKHGSIKEIISYSNSRLKLILSVHPENEDIIVSREKVSAFKTWLGY